jgi:hypothetical protein
MFCPSCGFEYTQKTNYCKRCGGSLSVPAGADAPKMGRTILAAMFCAVAAFGLAGMITVFIMFDDLVKRGLRGGQLLHLNASALYMELAVPSFVFTLERAAFRERTASGRLTIGFERIQRGPSASGI